MKRQRTMPTEGFKDIGLHSLRLNVRLNVGVGCTSLSLIARWDVGGWGREIKAASGIGRHQCLGLHMRGRESVASVAGRAYL